MRRHFFEAKKITTPGPSDEALARIQELYKVERELREKPRNEKIAGETFVAERREACGPKLTALHEWLLANQGAVPPTTKLWPSLLRYLDDWHLTPDNNTRERGIRPFVMDRKRWVMSGSPSRAKSSCKLYTLIETAKATSWKAAKYLTRVFKKTARINTGDDWNRLLPWNLPR